jgi:cystathionine beta-synthase/cysteine synthase A
MKFDNILQVIGNAPMVKLHRVTAALQCDVYAKCEFLNPGGSIKDRIGWQMVLAAEKAGTIKPGDTLIEPTSGNTGIGIALAGAVRGYQVVITMPEKMSHEKQVVLQALGATIHRTPTEAAWDAPDSHISLAKRLQEELPNAHILDQYANSANVEAHYRFTAPEILHDLGSDIAMAVIGVGTGGTITGVAKKLKEANPDIEIVGVDPYGSILGGGDEVHSYEVEGIGYDFFPDVLDNNLVDRYIKVNDSDSFRTARQLIREEGLLVGGSSGAAVFGALQAARDVPKGSKIVVILPDSIRNYLNKFVDDAWMQAHHFSTEDKQS